MTEFVLAVLLRSVLLGMAGLALIAFMRGRSASVRHAVAAGTLVAILALPLLSALLPKRSIAVLPAIVPPSSVKTPTPSDVAVSMTEAADVEKPRDWHGPAVGLWGVGTTLLLVRYGFSLFVVEGWVRRGRKVRGLVLESPEVAVPMTAWLGRHVVLLPSEWRSWSAGRRRSVLRHELAHVRRGDWFTQAVGQIASALFWPNPFVWAVCRRLRDLAELAADDLVLTSGVAPSRYAQDLLEIAQGVQATSPALALPFARKGEVARRIEMVLKTKVQRGAVTLAGLIMGGLVLAGLSIPIATWAPSPRQGAAPVAKPGVEPTQINLSCALLAPGAVLAEKRRPASSGPAAVALSMQLKEAERLVKSGQVSRKIVSAPTLRTLSGMTAKVTIGTNEAEGSTIEITPTYNSDRSISMHVRVVTKSKGKPDDETSADLRVQAGNAALLLRPSAPGRAREIRAIIRPSVVESVKPLPER
ncbi:M56 family metallopeptidase [Fimbriimonas ginsengisoli]|uniref:Antirepressor regulating drug resistance n=1 Tax=Fimbriimonas ginsengisoli Gsoil 348 TaxID=661478 RepID=A0A068NT45_FIMGI|nr:M56 family metallopeptidase [Fimbriimonas ginsengisoli]AIE84804.1 Antirepressor regulating drug resistance [Fimbriimonas ginsengisoli Gsoil 348]